MYDNNGNANEQIENAPDYYFLSLENFSKNEEELATDTEKWLFLLQKSKFFLARIIHKRSKVIFSII